MHDPQRYLDQPFLEPILQLEQVMATLRELSQHERSPLPGRMRTTLSNMFVRLGRLRRELERHPEIIAAEKAREQRR